MDVRMPDGTIIRNVPEGITKAELMARLNKSTGGSFVDPLAQGATLGFSDELAGAAGATIGKMLPESIGGLPSGTSWGDAYQGIRNQALQNKEAFAQRNPKTSMALELGGGVATGGLGAGRAAFSQAVQGVPKYMRYAAAGAGPGAVAGAGYADPGERTEGAVTGGVIGGAVGASVPAVANVFKPFIQAVQRAVGRSVSQAEAKLLEAMARDGVTPEQAAKRLTQRPGSILPDVAGENVRGLARAAAAFPGRAKNAAENFLEARQYGSGDRVRRALSLADTDDVYGMIDEVNEVARRKAAPLYKLAEQTPIEMTEELETLLKRPSVVKAFQAAKRIAKEEGEELPKIFKIEDDKVVDILEVPNMKAWAYIKRGLDDVVESTKDDFGRIRGNEGYAVNNTRKALDNILKEQNPDFAEAQAVWSGKMRFEEALKRGQKFLTEDADLSERAIKKMTPDELEMFRVGVAKAIRDKINKMGDGYDVGKRIFGNKDMRRKLKLAFGDDRSFREFQKVVLNEMNQAQTRQKVLGNSVTGRLEAEKADLMVDPTFLSNLAQGNLGGAARAGLGYVTNRMKVPSESLGNELTQMMFTPNQQVALQNLLQRNNRILQLQRMNAGLLGGAGVAVNQ